jgi:hypothetical protein
LYLPIWQRRQRRLLHHAHSKVDQGRPAEVASIAVAVGIGADLLDTAVADIAAPAAIGLRVVDADAKNKLK